MLLSVEREGVAALLLRPEGCLDRVAQPVGRVGDGERAVVVATRAQQRCERDARRVGIALRLDERDRPLRERAVLVVDRVPRVLPPLIAEPRGRALLVLD